jgi:hypothetical protein
MRSVTPLAIQWLVITSLAGISYFITYRVNEAFDDWALYAQGISLIFLPAGIKHLAILLGGVWGALGCFLALFILTIEVWAGHSWLEIASYSLISTASTWVGILFSLRVLGISRDLKNLKFMHLLQIDLITTGLHGFTINAYLIWAGMKTENFVRNALAMSFGDFVGSFILLTLLWLSLNVWDKTISASSK